MIFIWVALYGAVYTIADGVWGMPWITALAVALYAGLLVLWIIRSGRADGVGLRAPRGLKLRDWASFLPLLLLPVYNVVMADSFGAALSGVVLMAGVSVVEEIFFRGFLLPFLTRKWGRWGIILSAAAFALFHCVNLPRAADPGYVGMQVLCALAAGLCYGAVALRCRSILPCAAAHILTNVTGLFPARPGGDLFLWVCIAVYLGCGLRKICWFKKETTS